ncbi:MAG: VOC family protein [Acidimicrobiia bacterium]
MSQDLDHTIVYVQDLGETIAFYTDVMGFDYDGRLGSFEVVRVNEHLTLDLEQRDEVSSMHYAFVFDRQAFADAFTRLQDTGMPYGDGPGRWDNMQGPGPSTGAQGVTQSVYFKDPSGHLVEMITYDQ